MNQRSPATDLETEVLDSSWCFLVSYRRKSLIQSEINGVQTEKENCCTVLWFAFFVPVFILLLVLLKNQRSQLKEVEERKPGRNRGKGGK